MIHFAVPGNQEDPRGNPIGYTRQTQAGRWTRQARRYEAWKDYVWTCLCRQVPDPPRYGRGQKVVVSCYIEYCSDVRSDPGNVVKGIADALGDRVHRTGRYGFAERRLYPNDRCVLERVRDYAYSDQPGVLVTIYPLGGKR